MMKIKGPWAFLLALLLFFITAMIYAQERDPAETVRFNTIKYGTETEIADLIKALQTEGESYLDDEIIALVQNTRNRRIVSGALSFFAGREKSGLEGRAMRAIEEYAEEESETVLAAIDYLGRVKAGEAGPILRGLLDSGERRFLNSAFTALGRVGGAHSEQADEIALYIVDYYENRETASENHRDMITALGAAGSALALPFLANIAEDNDARVPLRIAAIESIAAIGDPLGLDAVLACISARDPNLRSAAVTALGPFSGDAVDEAILDAFRDTYYRTRIAAAQASRQRKLAAAVPYLQFRAERDEVPTVREQSVRALGAIATAEAIKVLEDLFLERKTNDRIRITSSEMLMQNEPGRFLEPLIKEMDEAKLKNQTALYNGFLKVVSEAKTPGMEPIASRLIKERGVVEKSYALDIASNNSLVGLAEEIKTLTGDRNESLARKARQTLERLGL